MTTPLFRSALRRMLEQERDFLVVGEAASAEEALDRLESLPADMVVMDIELPGMNGADATRQIKARHPEMKVVVLSAFGEEYLIASIRAGADGYLLKTLGLNEVARGLLQSATGQPPIDPGLTRHLIERAVGGAAEAVGPTLPQRCQEVLRLVAEEVSSEELASNLFISRTTLKRDLRNIFNLLGVNDRAHAVAEAYRRKLI